ADCIDVVGELVDVEPIGVEPAARDVAHGDDLAAVFLGKDHGGVAAYIAEALHGHRCAFKLHADAGGGEVGADRHAAAGRIAAPRRAAERHRLAGDHAELVIALQHGELVEHPGHNLRVREDVRRGHV